VVSAYQPTEATSIWPCNAQTVQVVVVPRLDFVKPTREATDRSCYVTLSELTFGVAFGFKRSSGNRDGTRSWPSVRLLIL
jgi:hypothetical protein